MVRTEETDDWVSNSKKINKILFSELDVLLRALDRFFNLENFTASGEDPSTGNFYEELITARDVLLRILGILEVVIPESRKNVYWLQKFAETKLLTTHKRDMFRKNLYRQDTPEKGLYLLYDSFINLKGVISDLLAAGNISFMSFMNIGNMISKGIRENNFFNPFSKGLNPEFDVISNAQISDIVRTLKQREIKKHVSIIYIYLFRFIRFISFIDIETRRPVSLNSSLMILLLLRSEINIFQGYVDKAAQKMKEPELVGLLKTVSYQFSMESRRVYVHELRGAMTDKEYPRLRGKIENSYGILKNLTEQSIVQLTHFFRPGIKGEEIFSSFVAKVQQSLRLREDIFVLHRFISLLESKTGNPRELMNVFESLRSYMIYFESFTFRLLRHDDYDEFAGFFNEINSLDKDILSGQGFKKVLEGLRNFKIYLEMTMGHIANRAELLDKSIDTKRVEMLIRQYL